MITFMCKIICVTNRLLCRDDFTGRIRRICEAGADAVILREKDLPPAEYKELAKRISEICAGTGVRFVSHTYPSYGGALHLPLPLLREFADRDRYPVLGASVHSAAEAQEAVSLGTTYLTAGHIFETDCKAGLPGRGLSFLREVCSSVSIPVYAIGGITPENAGSIIEAGAAGICVMSSLMTSEDEAGYIAGLRRGMNEYKT